MSRRRAGRVRPGLPAAAAAWVALAALLGACGGGGEPGPPRILWGEDICDHCRMVISEERHAAAVRDGGRDYRFDDPGCLLEHAGALAGPEALTWVHDETGAWRRAGEAWFVVDPEGGTPMASGILAFGSQSAAAEAGRRLGSEPVRWSSLPRSVEPAGDRMPAAVE